MSIASRIAFTIIASGLFIIAAFMAVNYDSAFNESFSLILIPLMGFLFFFGFAIGNHVVNPVKKMLNEAQSLEKGHGRSRLYVKTKDEIGQLAKTFNAIAEKFEEHRSKIESLDVNVHLRTRALEEIIGVLEQKIKNRTSEWHAAIEELERAHALCELKDKEIADLNSQLEKMAKKVRKKMK